MAVKTLTVDGKHVSAEENETILQAATDAGINIPTLCHLEGVSDIGACRLCIVEVAGTNKLLPACTTKVAEGMEVKTDSERVAQVPRDDPGAAVCRAEPYLLSLRRERPL